MSRHSKMLRPLGGQQQVPVQEMQQGGQPGGHAHGGHGNYQPGFGKAQVHDTQHIEEHLKDVVKDPKPTLTETEDAQIVEALKLVFEPITCLRQVKKSPPWVRKKRKKSQSGEPDTATDDGTLQSGTDICETGDRMDTSNNMAADPTRGPALSQEEMMEKTKIKSCLSIGANNVIRSLEKDELRLVLVWRSVQPDELKRAVLSLAASAGCPAACVSDLLTPVRSSMSGLTSLTALGFKKTNDGNPFDDFVAFVKEAIPKIEKSDIVTQSALRKTPETCVSKHQIPSEDDRSDLVSMVTEKSEIAHCLVDYEKYYIKKDQSSIDKGKTFDQQDFIKFEDSQAECVIEIVGGKPVTAALPGDSMQGKPFDTTVYSIAAARFLPDTGTTNENQSRKPTGVHRAGKKQRGSVKSDYKSINITHPTIDRPRQRRKRKK